MPTNSKNQTRDEAFAQLARGVPQTGARHDHDPKRPYTVAIWGSEPWTEDDCWTGEDYATLAEAELAATQWEQTFAEHADDPDELWLEIDGPDVSRAVKLRDGKKCRDDDDDWRREMAMEAGMLHGIDAYNDAMGY